MKSIVDVACNAALEAGNFLSTSQSKALKILEKQDGSLVTEVDLQSEKIINRHIIDSFPGHRILGEESGLQSGSDDYLWIVDPIDGTHNYIRQIPLYGVSIGVVYRREFIAGVIYLPFEKALFCAEKGGGACKNGNPIQVSSKKSLKEATAHIDSCLKKDSDKRMDLFKQLSERVFNIRMFGTSAVVLSYIAEGKIDLTLEFDDKPWDFAAGYSLITEAGGVFTDLGGNAMDYQTMGYIACNKHLHESILSIVI